MILTITKSDIKEYRDIYYTFYKPFVFQYNGRREQIEKALDPILSLYGWSREKFTKFLNIDLSQRIAEIKNKNFESKKVQFVGVTDSITISTLPQLKCPIRTTQKD